MSTTHGGVNNNQYFNNKPDFHCLPFQVNHYMKNIDVGTYVEFTLADNLCYFGRVTTTMMSAAGEHQLKINQFVDLETLNWMLIDEVDIPPLRNRYIDVAGELVQTTHFLTVDSSAVTRIFLCSRRMMW